MSWVHRPRDTAPAAWRASLWAPVRRPLPTADIASQHAGILEAIAEGDELRAQALALEHSAYETEVLIDAHLEVVLRSEI